MGKAEAGALEALSMSSPSDVLQFFQESDRVLREAKWAMNTLRQYASQWSMFCRWCEREGRTFLPASVATLRAFVAYETKRMSNRGQLRKVEGIRQALAAIRFSHHLVGKSAPIDHPDVRQLVEARRMVHDVPVASAEAVTVQDLLMICARYALNAPGGARNRAVLCVAFAGALRRGEIARLVWGDVAIHKAGVMLTVSEGRNKGLTSIMLPTARRHPLICPVAALRAWHDMWLSLFGPLDLDAFVFPRFVVDREAAPLNDGDVGKILMDGAKHAGIATRFTAQSLRVGWASAAAESGATLEMIMLHMRCGAANAAKFFRPPEWNLHPSAGIY